MVKGYKVFNSDWTCRGFQFEVGKTFEEDVTPDCCNRGFHFCEKPADCFSYYDFDSNNKVAEVIALGVIDTVGKKSCTNKIQIVREIPWQEVLTIVNTGKDCTGLLNTGNSNTGDWNTGDSNTGNSNTGDRNTGNWNTGNGNTGDWNKSSFSNGCFNTVEQKIMLFNKPSNWTYSDWLNSDAKILLNQMPNNVVEWIFQDDMTDEEKKQHPKYKTTGGYLKVLCETKRVQDWWRSLLSCEKNIVKAIPNFDAEIFKQCTGIDVNEQI